MHRCGDRRFVLRLHEEEIIAKGCPIKLQTKSGSAFERRQSELLAELLPIDRIGHSGFVLIVNHTGPLPVIIGQFFRRDVFVLFLPFPMMKSSSLSFPIFLKPT